MTTLRARDTKMTGYAEQPDLQSAPRRLGRRAPERPAEQNVLPEPGQNGHCRRIGGYNNRFRPAGRTVSNPIIPTLLSCRSLRTAP